MASRRSFVASAAASLGALIVPPTPAPRPHPAHSPAPHHNVSPAAHDLALQMRQFDPRLSDAEVATIARGIDANLNVGKDVNPRGKVLHNWDEPATIFEVRT